MNTIERERLRRKSYNKWYYSTHKQEHIKRVVAYNKRQYASNTSFKLAHQLRNRLRMALKRGTKVGSAVKDLGCPITEFKTYIEPLWRHHNASKGDLSVMDFTQGMF